MNTPLKALITTMNTSSGGTTTEIPGALLGSVASDPTYYSGGTGLSSVGRDGFSERFPLSRLYWYQGLRQVQILCGNGTV